jgi:hypothetical protein
MLFLIDQTKQSQRTHHVDDNFRLREQNRTLLQRLDEALNEIALLKEENQRLKDEISILKKQKSRPKIPPNILEGRNSSSKQGKEKTKRGKHPRQHKIHALVIHETVRLKPESIPEGAVFKGTQKYTVQDIRIQNFNVVYERERWQLTDGTHVTANLPKGIDGHYGPELKAFVLHQHYSCRVTEPLLLQSLRLIGVLISAGQLNKLLTEGKEDFHQEKQEILMAGIEATGQIQVDDIGARHAGKNAYTTVIGNSLFAFFSTNPSKSRVNFLQVLHSSEPKYLLNEDAWAYIYEQNPKSRLPDLLRDRPQYAMNQESFAAYLDKIGIKTDGLVRLATEAALFANLIGQGIPRDLNIHSDDAGQFAVFICSLCWIHEERHYRKFQVYQAETEEAIQQVRGQIWELYKGLKAYKDNPSESERNRLEQEFDKVFLQKTSSSLLNERLALSFAKKERLLMVLDNPSTPLHNNATETDGRAGVVAKKVSGGTRSEAGKKARDTFLSLKQTTRKLGINFYEYLKDRLSGQNNIPRLSNLIRAGSVQPAAP